MVYLDDLIFASRTAREALSAAQLTLHILPRFGWLVHPTKCQGVLAAIQSFVALGTTVCLASQSFAIPPDRAARALRAGSDLLATGPRVVCRSWPALRA